ncbi:MAG: helix-turn-helix domain-containing protein [Acidimicrobiales bacterium]|nr:helix-turn-helix domain-containing protein [Acidimicrobiales bacterium]
MEVELVKWPAEESRLTELRSAGSARLLLVEERAAPPVSTDVLEDWVRLPCGDDDLRHRMFVLAERVRKADLSRPTLDENGVLRCNGAWVSLPPVEHRLVAALLDRFDAVVCRDVLARAGWNDVVPDRNVLDVHVVRLRRRIEPLGLVIRTIRSRGYLMEHQHT